MSRTKATKSKKATAAKVKAKSKAPVKPKAKAKAGEKAKPKGADDALPTGWPKGCSLKEKAAHIRDYECFEFERRVYRVRKGVGGHTFCYSVSNFTCYIHMHIIDEQPTRLISVENVYKEEYSMHVAHDVFNTLQQFRKAVTGRGNYQWTGTEEDYQKYLAMLMDRMGKGRMVLELGMQPEGMFVFTNMVCNGSLIPIDKFGCFDMKGTKFYVPAANITEGQSDTGYTIARRIEFMRSEVTFEQLNAQMLLVHREHAMLASVHAVGTVMSDHIRHRVLGFPVPCYYGPPGTGKDQVVKGHQALYGRPQPAIRLPALNTGVAQVNVFAESRCISLYGTEWNPNLPEAIHAFVEGWWDGEGRKRGDRVQAGRSRYATEDVPIRCTGSLGTNYYPNIRAQLLDRLVVSEMKKLKDLTPANRADYRALNGMAEDGYSYLLADVVKHREDFVANWYNGAYKYAQDMVGQALGDRFISERMRTNISVLLSIRLYFEGKLKWAFSSDRFCAWLVEIMLLQQSRTLSGDEVGNFWTCFINAVNSHDLKKGRDFAISQLNGTIGFFWSSVFPVYMEHHGKIFGNKGLRDILNKLKQHDCFIPGKSKDVHEGFPIGERKSTAYVFDVNATGTDLVGLLGEKEEVAAWQ